MAAPTRVDTGRDRSSVMLEPVQAAVPVHVGFIMDGNGRWAQARGLNVAFGHRAGLKTLERVLSHCQARGVRYATCYAFSTENWQRPKSEVDELLRLARFYLHNKIDRLASEGVRLRVIGRLADFSPDLVALIARAEARTRSNDQFHLTLALSYGGRDELVQAARALAEQVASGTLRSDQIDEAALAARLFTGELPDPDLIIRTSGEQRLSNFLLWQMAYSELYFSPTLWPDVEPAEIDRIFLEVSGRKRRFGSRSECAVTPALPTTSPLPGLAQVAG